MTPRVTDNDRDEITVTLDGKEIRGWSYADEAERRVKMRAAREFVEGWLQATEYAAAKTEPHIFDATSGDGESCAKCGANWRDTTRHLTATA